MTCEKCDGRGFTVNEDGKFRICICALRERHKNYLEPMKAFLSPYAKSATSAELRDGPQALVKTDNAVLGLIKTMVRSWYPEPYVITTMEACNEAGFQRHPEFHSISELAGSSGAFVLDLSFMNKMRARNNGLKEADSMYLMEFVHEVVARRKGKLAIILDPRIGTFLTAYADVCDGLAELGIEYFDGRGYRQFHRIDDGSVGGNHDLPI